MLAAAVLIFGFICAFMIRQGDEGSRATPPDRLAAVAPSKGAPGMTNNQAAEQVVILVKDAAQAEGLVDALAADGSIVGPAGATGPSVEVIATDAAAQLKQWLAESESLLAGSGHSVVVYDLSGS
jgi:hypothetical protein